MDVFVQCAHPWTRRLAASFDRGGDEGSPVASLRSIAAMAKALH